MLRHAGLKASAPSTLTPRPLFQGLTCCIATRTLAAFAECDSKPLPGSHG